MASSCVCFCPLWFVTGMRLDGCCLNNPIPRPPVAKNHGLNSMTMTSHGLSSRGARAYPSITSLNGQENSKPPVCPACALPPPRLIRMLRVALAATLFADGFSWRKSSIIPR